MLKSGIRMILLIIAISIAAFFIMEISPIDPLQTNIGQTALGIMSQEQIEKLQNYWGTNENAVKRYIEWITDFISGDMGISLLYRQPVYHVITQRLTNSIWILCIAWLLSGIFGVALGIISATKEGSILDKVIKGIAILFSSTPVFWFALIVLMIFSVWLKLSIRQLNLVKSLKGNSLRNLKSRLQKFVRFAKVKFRLMQLNAAIVHQIFRVRNRNKKHS